MIARTFIESAYSAYAAQADRSARRQTVRATWRWAAGGGAAVEDERAQLGQVLVVVVAPALEAVDVVLLDAQRRVLRVLDHRRAEVRADVEQVVLHVRQHRGDVVLDLAGRQHHAEVGVGLVDVGVRLESRVGLAGLAHVAEAGRAGVAGARVDARQVDHAASVEGSPPAHWARPRVTRVTDVGSFRVVSEGPLTRPLSGTVHVGGAKNSALKLMAASLLAPGRSVIHNVPNILDVAVMGQLLRQLGCTVEIAYPGDADPTCEPTSGRATIEVPEELEHKAPYELVRRLRASIAVLGPLVARCRRASVALPGGDAIGSRGLDMHILGLQELGAVVRIEHGQVVAEVPDGLRGANLWLDFPSVGATENLVMAAVMAQGTTVIDNVAREPEIIDLCEMLVAMGARIDGISTSTLVIEGVERLHPVEHTTVTDRIVTGTWVFASAIAGGDLHISGGVAHHLDIVLDKLVASGAEIEPGETGFTRAHPQAADSFDVATLPYPGFPTDLQPFAMALAVGVLGHRDDHRERLRGAVHVRPGARPARLGPAHRRPPRRRTRCADALGRPRGRPRHPRRSRAGARRAGRAGNHRGRRVAAHRPRISVVRRGPRLGRRRGQPTT